MQTNINRKRLWILISVILILTIALTGILFFAKAKTDRVHPENGVLDLKNWQPEQNGALSLSGSWDFYWGRFISYQEFTADEPKADVIADVPAVWNSYEINGRSLPGFGFATYRLKIINSPAGVPLSLRIPTFSTAYALYVNERLISSNGKVGTSKEEFSPEYRPEIVEFTPEESDFEIIIHVSNFIYSRGGMWYAIDMGKPEQIKKIERTIIYKDLFYLPHCWSWPSII